MLIGCTCIILVLFTWAILSSRVETYDHCTIGQPVITPHTPVYTHGMITWAEQARSPLATAKELAQSAPLEYTGTRDVRETRYSTATEIYRQVAHFSIAT
jgi:hypothetical protein